MKELSIEEKAKAYDDALEKLRSLYDDYDTVSTLIDIKEELEHIFPELAESEDEKIRKEIIEYFEICNIKHLDWITWLEKQGKIVDYYEDKLDECACKYFNKGYKQALEKQGEQMPAEEYNITGISSNKSQGKLGEIIKNLKTTWSEKDEVGLANAMWAIEQARTIAKDENDMGNLWYAERWLKSLKDRVGCEVNCTTTKEWSEEDESILQGIWDEILANKHQAKEYEWKTYDRFLSWLKSLRPQNRWKPSDEQIGVIEAVINNRSFQRRHLDSLYEQLKKLKED